MDNRKPDRKITLLQRVEIREPCPVRWRDMTGNDSVRFCSQCGKNVYRFAAMTSKESERLIATHGTELCGQIERRFDGTIKTRENVGTFWRRMAAGFMAAMFTLVGAGCVIGGRMGGSIAVDPDGATFPDASDMPTTGSDGTSDPVQ